MSTDTRTIEQLTGSDYKYGFVTQIDADTLPRGLNETVIREISARKREPEWLLDWRLKGYRAWLTMTEPAWQNVHYEPIDYQQIRYYSAPRKPAPVGIDQVDPELLRTFEKLGVPLAERSRLAGVAVDAVFDSVSVVTTFKETLAELGIIFGSFSDAVQEHPELVRKYLGSVVPYSDNFFAALNAAVFSDGSFCYIPKGVRCPMELSTYFRINAAETGSSGRCLSPTKARLSATSRGARRRGATGTSSTRRWSSWWRSTARRSSTRRSRTGTRATRPARAASTTSSPSAAPAGG
jgi:Fe-S cluster assembly protein SufB